MSKYVRTTDNKIIKIDEKGCIKEFEILKKKRLFAFRDSQYSYRYENGREVKEVADKIEDLCDEIIIRHLTSSKPYIADGFQKTQILKDRQKAFEYGVEEVKFAIWVGMDLINVAKMNDKGELELI